MWEPYFETRGGEDEFGNYSLPDYRFKRLISEAEQIFIRNQAVEKENKILGGMFIAQENIRMVEALETAKEWLKEFKDIGVKHGYGDSVQIYGDVIKLFSQYDLLEG